MIETEIKLTDEEWMSILDPERDGLPICCGNISALRDEVYKLVRNSCKLPFYDVMSFFRAYLWCFSSHELPDSPVHKILEQALVDSDNSSLFKQLQAAVHGDEVLKQEHE